MYQRNIVSSLVWALMPVFCALRSVFHGALWLGLLALRKVLQLKYQTGFAAMVLTERAQLESALMCASFVVYRLKRAAAGLRFELETALMPRSPIRVCQRSN